MNVNISAELSLGRILHSRRLSGGSQNNLTKLPPLKLCQLSFTLVFTLFGLAPKYHCTSQNPHCKKDPVDFTANTDNWLPVHVP